MKRLSTAPALISSLRVLALPLFFYLFNKEDISSCLILLVFCAATDYSDGWLARKLKVTTKFGAYYDALTDFILMIGIFTIFYRVGFYPVWFLFLIAASFIQFLATSRFIRKLYDPVGRYLGSALYIGVVLTLIYPVHLSFSFVQYAFAGFFLVSLVSRIISVTHK
jgi:CDP-diacylglycerol--glycerol-3-phosphate 3-phosphatidyltransferase/cardiolipin synthase